jgi:hypothetical protein
MLLPVLFSELPTLGELRGVGEGLERLAPIPALPVDSGTRDRIEPSTRRAVEDGLNLEGEDEDSFVGFRLRIEELPRVEGWDGLDSGLLRMIRPVLRPELDRSVVEGFST